MYLDDMPPHLLRIGDASRALGKSSSTTRRMVDAGAIKGFRGYGDRRVCVDALRQYLISKDQDTSVLDEILEAAVRRRKLQRASAARASKPASETNPTIPPNGVFLSFSPASDIS